MLCCYKFFFGVISEIIAEKFVDYFKSSKLKKKLFEYSSIKNEQDAYDVLVRTKEKIANYFFIRVKQISIDVFCKEITLHPSDRKFLVHLENLNDLNVFKKTVEKERPFFDIENEVNEVIKFLEEILSLNSRTKIIEENGLLRTTSSASIEEDPILREVYEEQINLQKDNKDKDDVRIFVAVCAVIAVIFIALSLLYFSSEWNVGDYFW